MERFLTVVTIIVFCTYMFIWPEYQKGILISELKEHLMKSEPEQENAEYSIQADSASKLPDATLTDGLWKFTNTNENKGVMTGTLYVKKGESTYVSTIRLSKNDEVLIDETCEGTFKVKGKTITFISNKGARGVLNGRYTIGQQDKSKLELFHNDFKQIFLADAI